MADPVIRVESLSKRYRVGEYAPYGLLSEKVGRMVEAPFRRLFGRPGDGKREEGDAGTDGGWLWALKDVSFEVYPGEVIGVVGRNGAGKSTLLKVLSRITSPTEGRVELRGRVASLLELGTGFHPELTGRENVFLNGAILGMPRRETAAIFDDIVDYAEIRRFIDTPVKFYSSGMKVRLGFAVAAHLDSEVLIIDEVLSVGDLAFRQKSSETIESLREAGRTILFVTHNIGVVGQLAQRCVYLHEGAVRGIGPTDDVLALYQRDVFGPSAPSDADDVPNAYRRKVRNPAVAIENVSFSGSGRRVAGAPVAGEPAALSFEIVANADVEQADLRVLFFRERAAIRQDYGHRHVGVLSLRRGERRVVEVAYPSLALAAGDVTVVIFVTPGPKGTPRDAISKFHRVRMMIEAGDDSGAGIVQLRQTWRVHDAPGAKGERSSRISV